MRSAALVREGVAQPQRPEKVLPRKRHICFVAPNLWPVLARDAGIRMVGGAGVQQSVLIRLLQRDGYRVSVVTQDFGRAPKILFAPGGLTYELNCALANVASEPRAERSRG